MKKFVKDLEQDTKELEADVKDYLDSANMEFKAGIRLMEDGMLSMYDAREAMKQIKELNE